MLMISFCVPNMPSSIFWDEQQAIHFQDSFDAKSERIKSVVFHSERPWILATSHGGRAFLWDLSNQVLVQTYDVASVPVRCGKFLHQKLWFVTGADDFKIRIHNIDSAELVAEWEAHTDYIRFVDVHPIEPWILSCGDDRAVRIWSTAEGENFSCVQSFEGHTHYVMMAKFSPLDRTLASCSLDGTIKVWNVGTSSPLFTLEGHTKGINCIEYCSIDDSSDRLGLASGADDNTIKIWDFESRSCVQTLEGHTNNVSSLSFVRGGAADVFPKLVLSTSEDGSLCAWGAPSLARCEDREIVAGADVGVGSDAGVRGCADSRLLVPVATMGTGLDRGWAVAAHASKATFAIGCDGGFKVIDFRMLSSDELASSSTPPQPAVAQPIDDEKPISCLNVAQQT